mmetsp:Transcript_29161/g.72057  ORF Transcript_29161/g.72057 Transcript_29161/m.72057 type:complete len:155 (-) Transcript_29161:623-1087(-)
MSFHKVNTYDNRRITFEMYLGQYFFKKEKVIFNEPTGSEPQCKSLRALQVASNDCSTGTCCDDLDRVTDSWRVGIKFNINSIPRRSINIPQKKPLPTPLSLSSLTSSVIQRNPFKAHQDDVCLSPRATQLHSTPRYATTHHDLMSLALNKKCST